jgi:predicted DsbA family dithiol-disulfide isomerase
MMRIDFISDIACPWCALGLASLEKSLSQLGNEISYELHFQPFELNPDMPREGKNLAEYLSTKYGMSAERVKASHEQLRQRGEAIGFVFGHRDHIWNTFDAHRLLYWAGLSEVKDSQLKLKLALLRAYHTEVKNPSDPDVLLALVEEVGLDKAQAQKILQSDTYTKEVRSLENEWHQAGINAVPSIVIDRQHLLQGAQPVETLVAALQQLNPGR